MDRKNWAISAALDGLESRLLFAGYILPPVDLRVDANRSGTFTKSDERMEDRLDYGLGRRGALLLANLDRDNTTNNAPDNWSGGYFAGQNVAPSNVIDNNADLADIGRLRLKMWGVADYQGEYIVTLRVLPAKNDPEWFKNVPAQDRVRVFMPTSVQGDGSIVPQAGDVACIGPGLGDTIKFRITPALANEYSSLVLAGDGWLEFGVEGIKLGAGVRFEVSVETREGAFVEPFSETDTVAMRVAPLILQDNRAGVSNIPGAISAENFYDSNLAFLDRLQDLFGAKLTIKNDQSDLWHQDGYEIGYTATPTGSMPVVLELPRAGDTFNETDKNLRNFVRKELLRANVGVSIELAGYDATDASAYGGDIESVPLQGAAPGTPGVLISSGMPTYLRSFFAAQGISKQIDFDIDWLSVAHVDEVILPSQDGRHVMVADAELGWALLLWANQLDPTARMHPGMNNNEQLAGYNSDGIPVSEFATDPRLRAKNFSVAVQGKKSLGRLQRALKSTLGLSDELGMPVASDSNRGKLKMTGRGAFTSMFLSTARTFEIRFSDANDYVIRMREGNGAWSQTYAGRRGQDKVFEEIGAYVLAHHFEGGGAKPGDTFTFSTDPNGSMIRLPVIFWNPQDFVDPGEVIGNSSGIARDVLSAWNCNPLNSIVDGITALVSKAYGPQVDFDGQGARDLFDVYTQRAFPRAGQNNVILVDGRPYHGGSGGIHCGTNTIRDVPSGNWWSQIEQA